MNVVITGLIVNITPIVKVGDLPKRTLVLKTVEGRPQYYPIDFLGDKVDLLKSIKVGEIKKVSANFNGREYQDQEKGEIKYFTSLNAWKIENYS